MATERALPARVEELQRALDAQRHEMERALGEKDAEVEALRAQLAQVDASVGNGGHNELSAHPVAPPSLRGAPEVRSHNRPLKTLDLERFAGDREKTTEFVIAMDDRLQASGDTATLAGLEYATSHLTGYAASWWRFWRSKNPGSRSWIEFKPAFAKAFEMVDERKVYEKRLFGLKQTDSVEEYVDEFLQFSVKLPQLDDGFLQRRFSDGACPYLQEKYAGQSFDTLMDMVDYTLRLVSSVHPSHFTPEGPSVAPVVAAIAAKGGKPGRDAKCHRCGRSGHVREDCYAKLDKSRPEKSKQQGKQGNARRPTKDTAKFGKYRGSGRVNAVEADAASTVADSDSDDEVRQGKDHA